jgi:hypothetical protein
MNRALGQAIASGARVPHEYRARWLVGWCDLREVTAPASHILIVWLLLSFRNHVATSV